MLILLLQNRRQQWFIATARMRQPAFQKKSLAHTLK